VEERETTKLSLMNWRNSSSSSSTRVCNWAVYRNGTVIRGVRDTVGHRGSYGTVRSRTLLASKLKIGMEEQLGRS